MDDEQRDGMKYFKVKLLGSVARMEGVRGEGKR